MDDKPHVMELGSYDTPIELFGAYQVLIRSITESKFSERSFDDRIIASGSLARLADTVIEKLDGLGESLGVSPRGAHRLFYTVTSRTDRPYTTMLRKFRSAELSEMHDSLLRMQDRAALDGILDVIFSPYRIDDRIRSWFLEDLKHPLSTRPEVVPGGDA